LANWSSWCGVAAKKLKTQNGLAALRERLERVDLRDWNPTGRVVVTEAMEDMAESSRTWSNVEVDGLMELCREDWENGKLWMMTSEIVALGGGKSLTDLKAYVQVNGGRLVKHQVRVGGKKLSGTVLDLDSVLPRKGESRGVGQADKQVLDTSEGLGRFEGSTWNEAVMRVTAAWNTMSIRIKGDRSNGKY
jgi:hypothetical protein